MENKGERYTFNSLKYCINNKKKTHYYEFVSVKDAKSTSEMISRRDLQKLMEEMLPMIKRNEECTFLCNITMFP